MVIFRVDWRKSKGRKRHTCSTTTRATCSPYFSTCLSKYTPMVSSMSGGNVDPSMRAREGMLCRAVQSAKQQRNQKIQTSTTRSGAIHRFDLHLLKFLILFLCMTSFLLHRVYSFGTLLQLKRQQNNRKEKEKENKFGKCQKSTCVRRGAWRKRNEQQSIGGRQWRRKY